MRAEQRSGVLRPFFLAAALWLGAHAGAQHFGRPQGGRAFKRNHLGKAEGGSTAQDGTDIAGILHPVQNHRCHLRLHQRWRRQRKDETHGRGRGQAADVGKQRSRQYYIFRSTLCPFGGG